MVTKRGKRIIREAADDTAIFLIKPTKKKFAQQHSIAPAVSERWYAERDSIEPIKQIPSKTVSFDTFLQLLIGR
jgi:hypothetical protein